MNACTTHASLSSTNHPGRSADEQDLLVRSYRDEVAHLVTIPAAKVFAFVPAPGGRLICRGGVVWITQEADPHDHVLSAGQEVSFVRSSKVVVQSITDTAAVQLP